MPFSLSIFLAVFAAFWCAHRFIGRRGGVCELPGSWSIVLVAILAVLRVEYRDRLPHDEWSKATVWLVLFAIPYLSLQWFYSRRKRRQAHAAQTHDRAPSRP
jgi:hypothetical protein